MNQQQHDALMTKYNPTYGSESWYRDRKEARYQGAWAFVDSKIFNRSNIITDGITIYSYGSHYPMAIKVFQGQILVNKDRYSATTSKHMSALKTVLGILGYAPTGETQPDTFTSRGRYDFEVWARS